MTPVEALDVDQLPEHLIVLGGEVARGIGRHGTKRLAKAVLIGAVLPLMRRFQSFRIDPGKVSEKSEIINDKRICRNRT
ncbi:MAG: hypothetical protein WAK96_11235 [Desulfobaccales bacterium]